MKQPTQIKDLHCHLQKRWIVYSKEDVLQKVNENLNTITKYFKACVDNNEKIVYNLHLIHYMQSRFENVNNLLASLMINEEIDFDEYHEWMKVHEMIVEEFDQEPIDIPSRTEKLQTYIDSVLDLSIFDDEESDFDIENKENQEEELSDIEENKIPDNVSIYNVNCDNKKRKHNE